MNKSRILVVDDEPDVEALITQKFRRQLRKGELEFVFARDGQHALDVLETEPDVSMVLSDINMPRMNGLALLEQLNNRHEDLNTVIVSAYGDMSNIRSAMNLGAFDFITKPIEFDDLETTIAKTLAHARMLSDLRERRRVAENAHETLSRFFSPNVVRTLAEESKQIKPGGERKFATYLFTDLAGFTALIETSETDVIVPLLNDYIGGITKLIFEHNGTVTKIVGDAVHAIFGAPVEYREHAEMGVSCALAIDDFCEKFKDEMNSRGIPIGVTRVGVNSGFAIIGNFGTDTFFDYTAHGDAVNIAARLESANKQLGTRLLVSESVVENIDNFCGRPAGNLLLMGKSESLKAYQPMTTADFEEPSTKRYFDAYALLTSEDAGARQAFASLVGEFGEDPLTMFHLGRLLSGENGAEIELQAK